MSRRKEKSPDTLCGKRNVPFLKCTNHEGPGVGCNDFLQPSRVLALGPVSAKVESLEQEAASCPVTNQGANEGKTGVRFQEATSNYSLQNEIGQFFKINKYLIKCFQSITFCQLSANRENYTSSLPIWVTFISFACLIVLAKTSTTILDRSGE